MVIGTNKMCIPYKSTGTIRLISNIKLKQKNIQVSEKDLNVVGLVYKEMNGTDRGANVVHFAEETLLDSKPYFNKIMKLQCKFCFPKILNLQTKNEVKI